MHTILKITILLFITFTFYSCSENNITSSSDTSSTETSDTANESNDSLLMGNAINDSKELIRQFIEFKLPDQRYQIDEEELYSSKLLPNYYITHAFQPVWFGTAHNFSKMEDFITYVNDLKFHGFAPEDYHLLVIEKYFNQLKDNPELQFDPVFIRDFDLLLSDAYIIVAAHLYHGKVDPEKLTSAWGIHRNKPEIDNLINLEKIAATDSLSTCFNRFYPPYKGYPKMVEKAKALDSLISYDFTFSATDKLLPIRPNDSLPNMYDLRRKLYLLGHYTVSNVTDSLSRSAIYDSITQSAVKSLQRQFGFTPDAIIGKNTLNALNTPILKLKEQLFVNMERLRWLPDSLEKRHIFVNIADFTLNYFEGTDTLLSMRTVVGRNYRQTPVFHGKMSYLVFSPTWTVPPGILRNDVLPEVRKNINYLASKNMIVLDAKGTQVDPSTVDWKKDGMRYMIRQQPGAQNALGRVKFMFPNKHNVYLHDSPSKELFSREQRLFSSGCIRIERPKELAQLLLNDMPNWTEEAISRAMNRSSEQTVVLKTPVGVYIYYLTAWNTPDGKSQFRADVYNRDDEVLGALNAKRVLGDAFKKN